MRIFSPDKRPTGHVYAEIEIVERHIATMLCSLMRGVSSDLVFAGPLCVSILLFLPSLARVPDTADHGHDSPDNSKMPVKVPNPRQRHLPC